MTRIGIISDTHSLPVPRKVEDDFRKTDLIIHAGDFCSFEDFGFFKKIQKTEAVLGNMDEPALRRNLPVDKIIDVEGFRIGIIHGEGAPSAVLPFVQKKFANKDVQAVVFGHSHTPFQEVIDGVLFFNPGSPNDHIVAPYCAYGIFEISKGRLKAKIIRV